MRFVAGLVFVICLLVVLFDWSLEFLRSEQDAALISIGILSFVFWFIAKLGDDLSRYTNNAIVNQRKF